MFLRSFYGGFHATPYVKIISQFLVFNSSAWKTIWKDAKSDMVMGQVIYYCPVLSRLISIRGNTSTIQVCWSFYSCFHTSTTVSSVTLVCVTLFHTRFDLSYAPSNHWSSFICHEQYSKLSPQLNLFWIKH